MPPQQQNSSFFKTLGARVAQFNAETAGKPLNLAGKELPAGIRNGVAKLSSLYTKEQDKDDGVCPKGETFARFSAIVMQPAEYAGAITQVIIPLCDIPAKGDGKARPALENWDKFRSMLESLGMKPFPEPPIDFAKDPRGALAQSQRIEMHVFAFMGAMVEKIKTTPVLISFSTSGWTPKKTPHRPNPTEMVFHNWHGLADAKQISAVGTHNPAAGVSEDAPPPAQLAHQRAPQPNGAAPATQFDDGASARNTDASLADTVAALVDVAMNDPEGETPDGVEASGQLIQLAWNAGWTAEDTDSPPAPFTNDWYGVGQMALNPPQAQSTNPSVTPAPSMTGMENSGPPTVGSKWLFAKRGEDGNRLMNKSTGQPFPPQEVEVVALTGDGTCNVKSMRDGKVITNIKTKQPVAVKFEWLEPLK